MTRTRVSIRLTGMVWAAACILAMGACTQSPAPSSSEMAPMEETLAELPQGGIAIPAAVRDNLGITFARVERRAVSQTRRLPGQFELLPEARQEYRAPLAGRITLAVAQFQAVEAGDLLLTVDSPQWRQIQHEVVEAEGDIAMAEAVLTVARARRSEAQTLLGQQQARIESLAEVKIRKAELEAEAHSLRSSLPRLEAEVQGQEAALREAHEHYRSRLKIVASVTGVPVETLRNQEDGESAWRAIAALEVRAQYAGVVETLPVANGGWVEEGALAMTTVNPTGIRFHARVPQADILHFRDGMRATIAPPEGDAVDLQSTMSGVVTLGLTAHEADRTLSVFVTPESLAPWARGGVAGYLEVAVTEGASTTLAIPMAAVIQDGLEHVFYRRNPKDPDRALRVIADMGARDGRWVELRSGVKDGDEVVLDGVYALTLSGSAQQAPPGYHFHADGALHKNH